MSKADELKKEAEEYTEENGFGSDCNNLTSYDANCEIEQAYLAGAEPREKRIAELEKENKLLGERCNQLLKDKGNLTDANSRLLSQVAATTKRVIKLEQQIDKAVEIIKELGGIVREGVTCHYLVDYGALHKATLFLKEIK